MNIKDLILEMMVSNPNKENGITYYTPESLKMSEILKDYDIDEIEFSLRQIIKTRPELVRIMNIFLVPLAVTPTGLINQFLNNGGFKKIEHDIKEKEDIELRKAKTDLQLAEKMLKEYPKTKWIARISFFIAGSLAVLELIKFIVDSFIFSDKI